MKKVVFASLLVVASVALVSQNGFAQTQVNLGSNAQANGGGIQMSPAEYKAYNNAISQTTPQTKAPALEEYLQAYPHSAVLADTLHLDYPTAMTDSRCDLTSTRYLIVKEA